MINTAEPVQLEYNLSGHSAVIQSSSGISNGKVTVSSSTSISSLVFKNGVLNTRDNNVVVFQNFEDILFQDLQIIGRMRFENIGKVLFSNV